MKQIAISDVPVVIQGESGVGKEVLARQLHAVSLRTSKPFLKLNCAAVPSELLESELFGYERGAFTGAFKSTKGKFEIADGGTILLDEIGDMDFKLQAKLLHVLQDNEFQRLGGKNTIRVDVRMLAATHCDLQKAVAEGHFRQDLYYRLNVISIHVPPLRERSDEILQLARLFIEKHARPGIRKPEITAELESVLLAYKWPGNIRELENVIRRLLVFGSADIIVHDLQTLMRTGGKPMIYAEPPIVHSAPEPPLDSPDGSATLETVKEARDGAEKRLILDALEAGRWNRKRAAEKLQIEYKALLYKMRKLGITTADGQLTPEKAGPASERDDGAAALTRRTRSH
jgi:transcriptional regulator with GAF, ATPase, and Fis domain